VNCYVECRIIFYCGFIVDLIIKACLVVYMEPFKGIRHTSLHVTKKALS
jgi:hypothetical protein